MTSHITSLELRLKPTGQHPKTIHKHPKGEVWLAECPFTLGPSVMGELVQLPESRVIGQAVRPARLQPHPNFPGQSNPFTASATVHGIGLAPQS